MLQATTAATVTRAIDVAAMARLSFRDAMIIASAEQAGAAQLYTEDLHAGQRILAIEVVNPLNGGAL